MLELSGLEPHEIEAIKAELTIANPAYAQARRFAGFAPRDMPRHLYGYEQGPHGLLVAPGFGVRVWHEAKQEGRKVVLAGNPVVTRAAIPAYSGEVRGYQGAALEEVGGRRQGCIVAPCGGGKTDMGIQLICRRGVRTLIIVHTKELLLQWRERIIARAGIEPAVIGGGVRKFRTDADVTVATVQTLLARPAVLFELAASTSMVIVDECHHTPASTFTQVLRRLSPWYRYGITATPIRADGLSAMLEWWIGPILAEVKSDELEESGHILRPHVTAIAAPFDGFYNPDDPGSYSRLMQELVDDDVRTKFIAKHIRADAETKPGRHHLVLCNSISLCHKLREAIGDAEVVTGEMPKAERKEVMDRARSGSTRILIATTLADEGLDLPILDTCWLVTPTRSAPKTQQRIGRVCRPLPGKPSPRVFDFVDRCSVFKKQFRNRFYAVYRRLADYSESQMREVGR